MKKYKAIIMDYDMTIGDTADLIEECLYSNAARFGIILDRKALRMGIGLSAADVYRQAGVKDEKDVAMLDRVYVEYSDDIMSNHSGFFPGVPEALESLYSNGIKLAILSLKVSKQIWDPLKRYGLDKYFDTAFGHDDVTRGKPDPEGLFKLAKKMGVSLEDILYVGDSYTDMLTAENAGVDFAAVCTGSFTAEFFAEKGAKMIYPTFAEMCRALINNDL